MSQASLSVGVTFMSSSRPLSSSAFSTVGVSSQGVEFDSLKMYATYAGQPSAPRLMIDNLSLTPAARIH